LLLIGEVDCVKGFFTTLPPCRRPDILSSGGLDEYHGTESPEHYLELKTQKQSHNSKKYAIDIPYTSFDWLIHSENSDNTTYRKWYLQSHLLGIPEIFVGYRDDADILRHTKTIAVADIPQKITGPGCLSWNPQQNIDWGFRVLTALRKYCNNSGKAEETVWRVEVRGFGTGINIREPSEREVGQLNDNSEPRRLGIVPEWFVNEVRKQG
jgi:hypothetical protein